MKHGYGSGGGRKSKKLYLTHCAQMPSHGVAKARTTTPQETPRAPSENWTYRSVPKGAGGSRYQGNL